MKHSPLPKIAGQDLAWAEGSWLDPLTGTRVVCLSPDRKSHFRNNYFRYNMFTGDGMYAVFTEVEGQKDGKDWGWTRLWARNMITGELRDLGELPARNFSSGSYSMCAFAVATYSHRVNVLDRNNPDATEFLQIDIDTGTRRRIVPSEGISGGVYDPSSSADERYIYTTLLSKEKEGLEKSMNLADFAGMMSVDPGYQEMARVDLETGGVEKVFSTSVWWMAHPNPHPVHPHILMCCQQVFHSLAKKWGTPSEDERIRVIDLDARKWLNTNRRDPLQVGHEHWAPSGMRIYAHEDIQKGHAAINRIDLETGENVWYPCQPGTGATAHVMVAPNERFLVGDGLNFDRHTLSPALRARLDAIAAAQPERAMWFEYEMAAESGGETIWKYELPAESLFDFGVHGEDPVRLREDLAKHPEKAVTTKPICRFRSLCRTLLLGHRLESNAHVTPDSRWVVFQSSNEDDWFQVWAARVPGVD